MRATPLPVALPIAAAAIPLVAVALVPLAAPSTALAERWLRPVPGEVARTFDYKRAAPFARGAHRGADLVASPGTRVRAACGGVVVHAGSVAGRDGVVSVRCGQRRVSYLPLDAIAVREGAHVGAGAPLGVVAAGHGGLHLGVRRETDVFGYEDPLTLLGRFESPRAPVPVRLRGPGGRRAPRLAAPHPASPQLAPHAEAPQPAAPPPVPRAEAPHLASRPNAPHPAGRGIAPWPVWLGLALLAGAAGSRTIAVRRRRRTALALLRTTLQSTR